MKHVRLIIVLLSTVLGSAVGFPQLTLDYCLSRAHDNYPLIKKFDIINQTEAISLSDISKGWLPRIGAFAQATVQNTVSSFPDPLKAMLNNSGTSASGMSLFQYKAGVELNQLIWDGGRSKAQEAVQRSSTACQTAAIEVEMYTIRERVESIYFGLLLINEQIAKIHSTIGVLESNLTRLHSLVEKGMAIQSDANMIEAQLLTVRQSLIEAENTESSYRRVLSIFIDENIDGKSLMRPADEIPASFESNRPELSLFDCQITHNDMLSKAIDTSIKPQVGFFAQAYYGYPGFNLFESMMKRIPSFNAMAGIKISWNIDALYTKKNSIAKLSLASDMVRADRDIFHFNTSLKRAQELENIEGLRKVMMEDARIVELRTDVRQAAESQLNHGIIDTNALLTKISDETQAVLNRTLHEIQLLQAIYKLKNTLNQ